MDVLILPRGSHLSTVWVPGNLLTGLEDNEIVGAALSTVRPIRGAISMSVMQLLSRL